MGTRGRRNSVEVTQNGLIVDGMREIFLSNEDISWASQLPLSAGAYARTHVSGKQYLLHRLVMGRALDRQLLTTEVVDHIDGNPANNRRENLRVGTQSQNLCNQRRASTNRTSPFKGLCPGGSKGYYMAKICYQGTKLYIGHYNDAEEAAWMYDQWALDLHGDFARTNFDYVPVEQVQTQ